MMSPKTPSGSLAVANEPYLILAALIERYQ
jgi:hypothetical protein